MLAFLRDGFYRDLSVLILVTILVGSAFAAGTAWLTDSYFGDTITEMIGEYGEYDIIIHLREDTVDTAIKELERIAEDELPGARLLRTLTIAGQANVFFGFPADARTRESFADLNGLLQSVPGLYGYTVVYEPSLVIRSVHPALQAELSQRLEAVAGVDFVFQDGANLVVALEPAAETRTIANQANELLDEYRILELRFPLGFDVDTVKAADDIMALLEREASLVRMEDVTSTEYDEELAAFLKTLGEMRSFLLSYASKVVLETRDDAVLAQGDRVVIAGSSSEPLVSGAPMQDDYVVIEVTSGGGRLAEGMIVSGDITPAAEEIHEIGYIAAGGVVGAESVDVQITSERYRLRYAVAESLRLLHELDDLADEANVAVEHAESLVHSFQEALLQLDVLKVQLRQLNENMVRDGGQSAGEQLLITLLLNGLVRNLLAGVGGDTPEMTLETLENLDVEAMYRSLNSMADQISSVQNIDVQAIINQIEYVEQSLPQLADEEIGQSVRLINRYLEGHVIPGEQVQILLQEPDQDMQTLESLVQAELAEAPVTVFSSSVGAVNPDARSELFRLLKEVRATIAGLLAIAFTAVVLILDHAAIFSASTWIHHHRRCGRWASLLPQPTHFLGALTGSVILWGVFLLSRASIPIINTGGIILIGAVLGFLTSLLAERLSPVSSAEMTAGQALGLADVQIMREIVIPGGRPGIMTLLNRWRKKF